MTSYHLLARDGEIGHVEDFVADDETWAIRYLIVATTDFWPGKRVLVPPNGSRVSVGKGAPEYTERSLITRDHEIGLYGYYNRPGYWVEELLPA